MWGICVPAVLSATGAFSDVPNVVPTEGLIPFAAELPALVGRRREEPLDRPA